MLTDRSPDDALTIVRADLASATARQLIRELNAELAGMYPEPGANHFRLDVDEVSEGRGMFVIAWRRNTAVGCGALRRIDETTGELKRMYVAEEERGRGIGAQILATLENHATGLGLTRLLLETGIRQAAAIALYERSGFERIPAYGEYVASAVTSVCMAKDLNIT